MGRVKGIIYAALSAAIFGLMPLIVKTGEKHGVSTEMIVFLRYSLAFIFLGIILKIFNKSLVIKKANLFKVIYLGIIGCSFTSIMLYLSYSYIATGIATVIHFVYPIIATILAYFLLNEPLTKDKIFSLIISVIGFFFLIGFQKQGFSYVGAIIAFISGVSYAIYVVGIGNSEIKKMDVFVLTFYMTGFAAITMGVYLKISNKFSYKSIDSIGVIMVILLALLCTVVTMSLFAKSVQYIGSSNSAILSTLEPVTSIVVGRIVFNDIFTLYSFIGSTLIICSVIILILPSKNILYNKKKIHFS